MKDLNIDIVKYSDAYRDQILMVWENSVLATHDFLRQSDFQTIRKIVHTINFNGFDVYCLTCHGNVAGFIGIADRKVEMLFLMPVYGAGIGKKADEFCDL